MCTQLSLIWDQLLFCSHKFFLDLTFYLACVFPILNLFMAVLVRLSSLIAESNDDCLFGKSLVNKENFHSIQLFSYSSYFFFFIQCFNHFNFLNHLKPLIIHLIIGIFAANVTKILNRLRLEDSFPSLLDSISLRVTIIVFIFFLSVLAHMTCTWP